MIRFLKIAHYSPASLRADHTSSSSGSTPMARERQSAFRPSLDEKLDAALDYGAEPNPLFSIPYSSMVSHHQNSIFTHVLSSAMSGFDLKDKMLRVEEQQK